MASSAQQSITIENDEDDGDEVLLVGINTGVVDLTSDISSDEADYQNPRVAAVPKPIIENRQEQTPIQTSKPSAGPPNRIRHTIINIGSVVVPFIFRGEKQLTEKNIVEELLFFKYFRIFSDELIQCMTPVLFLPSVDEIAYFKNLHQQFKCSGAVSNILFAKDDIEKMWEFLKNCFDMLVLKVPKFSICGFVKVLGTLIPFIMHNWFKFMPLFYFENDSDLGQRLAKVSATFSNPWVISYLKLCCKIEGVREEFYLKSDIKLVNLNSLVKHLPDGTRVDIYWPEKFSSTLFRPDYLKSAVESTRNTIQNDDGKSQKRDKKQRSIQNKKSKSQSTIEQSPVEAKVNDIKVTIENVMTVSDDDSDEKDSEFTESSRNQNVIVIRANDTVPIQMSLNVGPMKTAQSSVNLDEVLASHNQALFNQNLRSETRVKLEEPKISSSEGKTNFTTEGFKTEQSTRENNVVARTFEHLTKLQNEFKAHQRTEQNTTPLILNSSVATPYNMSPSLSNLFDGKTDKSVEITMNDICHDDDDDDDDEGALVIAEPPSPATSVVSVASSTDATDIEQPIPSVSMATIMPLQRVPKTALVTSKSASSKRPNKAKANKSTFASPVMSNSEVKPYPVCVMENQENTLVPIMLNSSFGTNLQFTLPEKSTTENTMVMPKIVNSYSVQEEVQKPQPAFVRVEGTCGATPPPIMIIDKDNVQSILYRVTQLEDDNSSLLEGNFLVRQVSFEGNKFHCINLNPGKFTNWLISISEIEAKMFDSRTATQDLIKNFFQAGMELYRLNINQKFTYQLFKDPELEKHIQGLYIDYDEFQVMFDNIKASTSG